MASKFIKFTFWLLFTFIWIRHHTKNVVVKISAGVNSGADLLRRIEGWGEADPREGDFHETIDSVLGTLQTFAPVLLGKNALEINQLNILMQEISRDTPLAVGAIDIALWDIFGKFHRAPIHRLLGGTCGSCSLPLLWPIPSQTQMDDSLMIPDLMRQGFRTIVLKMGGGDDNIQHQIDRVRSINDRFSPEKIQIVVDVNQGWSLTQATQFINGIKGVRVEYIEQPLNVSCDRDISRLKLPGCNIKISSDESALTPSGMRSCLQTDDCDYISLNVGAHGGISRMKEVANACKVMGKKVVTSSVSDSELGISQAAGLHVAVTCANLLNCGHGFMTTLLAIDDVTNFKSMIRGGSVFLPQGEDSFGLGILVDLEKLEHYSMRETILFTK